MNIIGLRNYISLSEMDMKFKIKKKNYRMLVDVIRGLRGVHQRLSF